MILLKNGSSETFDDVGYDTIDMRGGDHSIEKILFWFYSHAIAREERITKSKSNWMPKGLTFDNNKYNHDVIGYS